MGNYKEKPKRKGPKKKSIKAPIHSKMDPKRKLSRMGKKRQKHKAGLDAVFLSRSACLKKLQITLKDFRRLCILKGVYPRQPRNNKTPHNRKGQVFYHLKDVRALAHEPILEKFRLFKSFMKKIKKIAYKDTIHEAKSKYEMINDSSSETKYTLHHLVKERYPRFIDALGDLDDALTLVFLFASIPSTKRIKTSMTRKAKDLACAWGAYCAMNHCITKCFISIKGVYLEAKILQSNVRWIVPHSFTQNLPNDVDYKVMATFFEFYECLLDFVLFKLYNDMGVRYPFSSVENMVTLGTSTSLLAAYLQTLTKVFRYRSAAGISDLVTAAAVVTEQHKNSDSNLLEITEKEHNPSVVQQQKVLEATKVIPNILSNEDDNNYDEEMIHDDNDDNSVVSNDKIDSIVHPLKAALQSVVTQQQQQQDDNNADTFNNNDDNNNDEEIHKRKNLFSGLVFFLSREVPRGYLEIIILSHGGKVGWESDDTAINIKDKSITHHVIDRPKSMIPSSFYDGLPKNREFIQPQWILDSSNFLVLLPPHKYAIGLPLPPHLSPWVNDDEEGYKPKYKEDIERFKNGEIVVEDDDEKKELNENNTQVVEQQSNSDPNNEEKNNTDDDEEEEEEEEVPNKTTSTLKAEEEETKALAKLMMSKKAKRLYGRMQHGIEVKQASVQSLERKRKEIDATRKDKSYLKQKVERLKDDRKIIEKEYERSSGSMKKKNKKSKK